MRTSEVTWNDLGQQARAFVFKVCDRMDAAWRREVLATSERKHRDRLASICIAWAGARDLLTGDSRIWNVPRPRDRQRVLDRLQSVARELWAAALEAPEDEDAGLWVAQSAALTAAVEVLNVP